MSNITISDIYNIQNKIHVLDSKIRNARSLLICISDDDIRSLRCSSQTLFELIQEMNNLQLQLSNCMVNYLVNDAVIK